MASLTVATLVFILHGCAATALFKFSGDQFPRTGPNNPVVRILGLWQPAQGMGLENKTSRGFAGQILFFDKSDEAPAQVDGEVSVFVFDDQGPAEEQVKPVHTVNFSAKAWNTHLYKGSLGATYDVFIPYPRPGVMEANCAIRVRYTPKGGPPVYSEMVNVVLPGKKKSKPAASSAAEYDDAVSASAAGGETAHSNGREPVREAPHARGIAQTIRGVEEIVKHGAQRPRPVELTEKERERILRDVKGRLEAEQKGRIELASFEEPDPEDPDEPKKFSRRHPARNPLLDDDEDERSQSNRVDLEGDEPGDSTGAGDTSHPATEPQSSTGREVFDEGSDE
ncbi:MAG: hypothetical protein ACM3U2_23300 [Deltaproteobacteria bacterium]